MMNQAKRSKSSSRRNAPAPIAPGASARGRRRARSLVILHAPQGVQRDAFLMLLAEMLPRARFIAVDALERADRLGAADLVLLDEAVGTARALDLVRAQSAAPVALLVSRGADPRLLGLGADACILKTESASAFAAALEFVLAGNRYISPDLVIEAEAEARWRRELIDRIPAAILVVQEDRRVYMNPAYARRAATLIPGAPPECLLAAPLWDVVQEPLRERLQSYASSWLAQRPLASRVKVGLRGAGQTTHWIECLVCRISFRGRRALGVVSTEITQAVEAADEFECALPHCLFGDRSLEACRNCLYGLPVEPGGPAPVSRSLEASPRNPLLPSSGDGVERGAGSDDAPRDSLARLSPRQRAVLRLIAQGKLNKQIAADLGITEATVKGYIHRLLKILDLPNRTAAALRYRAVTGDFESLTTPSRARV